MTQDQVHRPSAYVDAFRAADLTINGAAEPLINGSFVNEMPEGAVRESAREALVGLPFALIWSVHKRG